MLRHDRRYWVVFAIHREADAFEVNGIFTGLPDAQAHYERIHRMVAPGGEYLAAATPQLVIHRRLVDLLIDDRLKAWRAP